jgi:2-C-methyl-D-erythritol 4-phosphate cytidylyltransferase
MNAAGYYPARVTDVSWTVVVGGGGGSRFGARKQYERLGDARVIDLAAAAAAEVCDGVVLVVPPEDAARERAVAGGTSRSESVRRGLAAVPSDATIICVHDAVRPLASASLFTAVIDAVRAGADGAVPALPVTDTIKVLSPTGDVVETPERASLVAVQTPQAFRADVLRRAHATAEETTDDAALVERLGGRVVTVPGEQWNRKITEPPDLAWAQQWLADHDMAGRATS